MLAVVHCVAILYTIIVMSMMVKPLSLNILPTTTNGGESNRYKYSIRYSENEILNNTKKLRIFHMDHFQIPTTDVLNCRNVVAFSSSVLDCSVSFTNTIDIDISSRIQIEVQPGTFLLEFNVSDIKNPIVDKGPFPFTIFQLDSSGSVSSQLTLSLPLSFIPPKLVSAEMQYLDSVAVVQTQGSVVFNTSYDFTKNSYIRLSFPSNGIVGPSACAKLQYSLEGVLTSFPGSCSYNSSSFQLSVRNISFADVARHKVFNLTLDSLATPLSTAPIVL